MGNIQVNKQHYDFLNYTSKERFASFWHQINETVRLAPDKVLEIGVGNNIVNYILKNNFKINIETLDIDSSLNPDHVGSVLNMPIAANSFNCIICCQVLEHLPFDKFELSLREIMRVTQKNVVLSLPDKSRCLSFKINKKRLKLIKKVELTISIPSILGFKHEFLGEHYWEIGARQYPLRLINRTINEVGFKILKSFRVFEMPSHRFFILEK